MVDKTKYSAAIFRRGLKKELFDDGDETMPEDLELEMKLQELLKLWKLPRTGQVNLVFSTTAALFLSLFSR